ncbi:hypothetical protein EYZ11_011102 [Aspergillus tanneri]|uniref:Uncharacterized protein n=1 Tax=Aspergillus tanneri TaxID=1220188 RepID=A0A4S3J5U1_9EURO|nr:hypothetical protein EYZ11_011102 [Aspergillus tanneri]
METLPKFKEIEN